MLAALPRRFNGQDDVKKTLTSTYKPSASLKALGVPDVAININVDGVSSLFIGPRDHHWDHLNQNGGGPSYIAYRMDFLRQAGRIVGESLNLAVEPSNVNW